MVINVVGHSFLPLSGGVFSPLEATIFNPFRSTTTASSSSLMRATPLLSTTSASKPSSGSHITKTSGTLSILTEQSFPTDSTLISAPLASSALLGSTIPSQLQEPQVQSTPSNNTIQHQVRRETECINNYYYFFSRSRLLVRQLKINQFCCLLLLLLDPPMVTHPHKFKKLHLFRCSTLRIF